MSREAVEAFEAYINELNKEHLSHAPYNDLLEKDASGNYTNDETAGLFNAWQASRKAALLEAAETFMKGEGFMRSRYARELRRMAEEQ